ncbi:hypothetical protein FOBRF1_014061 [Fusarium oxysporum]
MSTVQPHEEDPFSRNIQLNTVEEHRGYHRKNEDGEIQRPNIVDDCCRGLVLQGRIDRIVHGIERPTGNPATLVVFGFLFHGLDNKRRFKQAIIQITFQDKQKKPKADPEVIALWPRGDFTLGQPTDIDVENSISQDLGVDVAPAGAVSAVVQAGLHTARRWEERANYRKQDRASLRGAIILNEEVRDHGRDNAVRLVINENITAESGIVADFRAVVLIRRPKRDENNVNPEDDWFTCSMDIKANAHFAYNAISGLRKVAGLSNGNDPVTFKPGQQYLRPPASNRDHETSLSAAIDENNLSEAKLDDLSRVMGKSVLVASV